MKILQLNKAYPPHIGGVETVVQQIATSIPTDVLCCSDSIHPQTFRNGHTVYKASTLLRLFSTPLSFHFIWLLWRLHRRYDILHVHHPDPMSALALFLVRPQAKIVLHWHSDIVRQKRLLKFYAPLQEWLLRRADRIIATTPSYIDGSPDLRRYSGKCLAVPIGIPKRQHDPQGVETLRSLYPGKKIVFSLGRFVYYKGFEYLIQAARHLDDSYVILLGGSGPLKEELEAYVQKHALKTKVRFIGKIDESQLGDYFAACDLFCLSSVERTEAFGIVQIEAMSFGKPVVATQIEGSGVSWVNAHEESGLNVPIKDPEALARAILTICNDSDIYAKFSHNARQRFLTRFTLQKMIETLKDLYKETAKKESS